MIITTTEKTTATTTKNKHDRVDDIFVDQTIKMNGSKYCSMYNSNDSSNHNAYNNTNNNNMSSDRDDEIFFFKTITMNAFTA